MAKTGGAGGSTRQGTGPNPNHTHNPPRPEPSAQQARPDSSGSAQEQIDRHLATLAAAKAAGTLGSHGATVDALGNLINRAGGDSAQGKSAFRKATRILHPDSGGHAASFVRLQGKAHTKQRTRPN